MAENRPRRDRSIPTPVMLAILLLSILTLYQVLQTSAELKVANADRETIRTTANNSIAQSNALANQVEQLGAKPVVNKVDIPKTIEGPKGETGPQGATGDIGPQGPPGPIGPQGPAGPQGKQGQYPQCLLAATKCVGPQGAVGPQGPAGKDGVAGPAGPQGPAGATGLQGPQGEQGPAGKDGAPGPAGKDGTAGADGEQGPPGPAGPTCPDGTTLTKKRFTTMDEPAGFDAWVCLVPAG
jgi:hypothetical protein